MKKKISIIEEMIENYNSIIITTHENPDGDALGSCFGLYSILCKFKNKVNVVIPNKFPKYFDWMPNIEEIIIFQDNIDSSSKLISQADLIFMLDFNNVERLGNLNNYISNSNAKKIMIDHHQDPNYCDSDIIISDTTRSSTCELLFEVINNSNLKKNIDSQTAECLYTGIITDTATFKHPSTTYNTHDVASKLLQYGLDKSLIHSYLLENNSEDQLRLLGYCINEKMNIYSEYKSSIISVTQEELDKFKFKPGNTEGIVNYPLSIRDINLSVFIVEKDKKTIKMSFRSKGNIRVNDLSKKYFNGGGHNNAAGGLSNLTIEETIQKLKEIFKKYKNELITNI